MDIADDWTPQTKEVAAALLAAIPGLLSSEGDYGWRVSVANPATHRSVVLQRLSRDWGCDTLQTTLDDVPRLLEQLQGSTP